MGRLDIDQAQEHNSMASVRLPTELIIAVLEHAYFNPPDLNRTSEPDYRTLSACSLVCRQWNDPAQSLLIRDLPGCGSIRTRRGRLLFAAIDPSTEHGKVLGQCVRALNLGFHMNGGELNFPEELADWLARCPRLYQLTLHLHGLHELGPTALHKLQKVSVGAADTSRLNIRALRLLSVGVQSELPYQLLSLWPSIQFLDVGTEIVAMPPSELPFNFHLYELVLQRTLPINIVERLLSASGSSLRVLDFRDPPSPEVINLLAKHGPHIRSLRLMRYNKTSAELVRLCTNLEELIIRQVPSVVPSLSAIPSSLQHLAFLIARPLSNSTFPPILSAVHTLPNLRVISCDAASKGNFKFHALQEACHARGVMLRVSLWQYWPNDDFVVARSFPRDRSVSNFHLMN